MSLELSKRIVEESLNKVQYLCLLLPLVRYALLLDCIKGWLEVADLFG